MVEKAVWKYSKKYHLDFAEIEGQGYLIFCEALEKFYPKLSCFSTYLTNTLNIKLNSYCIKTQKRNYNILRCKEKARRGYGRTIYVKMENIDDVIARFDYNIFSKVLDKMDYEISLSDDAKDILQYILSREWEDVDVNWIPRLNHIKKVYVSKGWTGNRIVETWQEIKCWWLESNKDSFCIEV